MHVATAQEEPTTPDIGAVLCGAIGDAVTSWSLGTFGAIGEFSRDHSEPVVLTQTDQNIAAVTARGAIAINYIEGVRLFPSEGVTKHGWSQRVALCLRLEDSAMSRRAVLTELGPDAKALRAQDQQAILFDLGLDAHQADFCVRVGDPAVVTQLRVCADKSVFAPDNPAMSLILQAQPHRVFFSKIGRVEVYQPIPPPSGRSPDGPHTHVLPKLLKSCRTHPATELVPEGWVPCAHFCPPHPAHDGMGRPHEFRQEHHRAFQRLLSQFGDSALRSLKQRVVDLVEGGAKPQAELGHDRSTRATIRIALRQLQAAGSQAGAQRDWLAAFDSLEASGTDLDDALLQHG